MHFYRLLRYRTGGVKRHETEPIVSATRTECEETCKTATSGRV